MDKFFHPRRLSVLQRLLAVPYFAVGSLLDPTRGDLVAGLGDITAEESLRRLHNKMILSSSGRHLLQQKPLITSALVSDTNLSTFRENSLGAQYYHYMKEFHFSADERTQVRFLEDPELAYVLTRYRQVHDFWHVLCGLPPSVVGEIALKWFEFQVTGLPVCLLSAVGGPLRLHATEVAVLGSKFIPWALRTGSQCRRDDLLSFPYEDNLHRSVEELRTVFNIEPAPSWKY
jgi:ubiquinone biosynthesis protein COQ4